MTLGTIATLSRTSENTERATGLERVNLKARYLNQLYCWSTDKQHLWGIANRHVWRIAAMYHGKPWDLVSPVTDVINFQGSWFSR